MTSRRHREQTSSTKKDDYQPWTPHDPDTDRPRQSMTSSQRHNMDQSIANTGHERHHRSSRRADASGDLPTSSAPYAHHKSSSRDQTNFATSAPSYYAMGDYNAGPNPVQPEAVSQSTNGLHAREAESYDVRASAKAQKRSTKRSPPSSDEKALIADQAKAARSSQNPRIGHGAAAAPAPQPPASTQTFWIPPVQPTRDPGPPSRHRDKDRDEDRDRRRDKERRREREKEKEREKHRAQEEERAREQERERDRERRREERRREKERAEQQQKYDEERERRRQERRARKAKEGEARRQQESRVEQVTPYPHQSTSAAPADKHRAHRTEDKALQYRQPYPELVPSSSSNIALPNTQYYAGPTVGSSSRPQATGNQPERDKRSHRSHRDRHPAQQNNHESGVSSSEQEHSGRERGARASDRRYTSRDYYGDGNPSGPSGSENERMAGRERRTQRRPAANDVYAESSKQVRGAEAAPYPADHGSAPTAVSIRAGQGPADPQTPILPPKSTPTPAPTSRARDTDRSHMQDTMWSPDAPPVHTGNPPDARRNDPLVSHMPAGLVRSDSIPQSAYLHPNAALAMAHQANSAPSSHPHYVHGAVAPPTQRIESQGPPLSNMRAPQAIPTIQLQTPTRPPSTVPASQHAQMRPSGAISAIPNDSQGFSATGSHSKQHGKPSPTQQSQFLDSKAEASHLYPDASTQLQSSAHIAKLSVYRSPDPPVSADLYLPKYNSHTGQQHQPAPLLSKLPLNEDSDTRQMGVHSSAGYGNSFGSSHAPSNFPQPTAVPSNSTPSQRPQPAPGEDTPRAAPLPIPEPRRTYSSTPAPVSEQQSSQSYNPRSPKQSVAAPTQTLSASPWQNSRPQVSPTQGKSNTLPSNQSLYEAASAAVDNSYGQSNPQASSRVAQLQTVPVTGSTSSHSPRNAQLNSLRSPAAGTPKQSSPGRLHPRNGSNDTITLANTTKASPSGASHRQLNQPQSNVVNIQQQPHALSRPDTTNQPNARPPTAASGYPDYARYRSQTPASSYPLANPSSQQQQTNVLSSNVNQSQANNTSSVSHQPHSHSRNPVQANNTSYAPTQDYSTRNFVEPTSTAGYHPYASTQDYQQRSQPTPMPTAAPSAPTQSSASAIAAAYRSGTYHQEYNARPSEPSSAPATQSSHRVPPRSAPSPAPPTITMTARHYPNMPSSSASRSAYPPAVAAPTPVRGQTYPTPVAGAGRPTATPVPVQSHSRTVSDPQYGTQSSSRVPVAGHMSTPAPSKAQLAALQIPSPAPEAELLRTPSSLAPSMVRGNSYGSINAAPSIAPSKEKEPRKRGFLGLFRSRSSPPKPTEVRPPVVPKQTTGRPRASSQSTMNGIAASVRNIVAPHPNRDHTQAVSQNQSQPAQVPQSAPPTQTVHQPPPIVAPTPVLATAEQGRSNGKMFTPFRLLSKRHRTVSAASVEAQDGTATNTVIDSTRSSTAGRPSPPLRDPVIATVDWRDREEAEQSIRKSSRRRRPGVTFDVDPDLVEENRPRPRQRSGR
ncbi:unnamed protein product [Somion occarium]|uniref:Uncharacterized protein n=1 Tax=Somion occarium TaxID=3059160 RepID=A0ABP1DB24_9APHY